jgi:hypothetical protein
LWLLDCPGAHAFWSYWWIGLFHLRELHGVAAALSASSVGWEIMSVAQNPDTAADADDPTTCRYLSPVDWAVQFGDVKNDADAERVLLAVIKAIVTGSVSPDSDFRSFWLQDIPDTAKCIAEGRHPTQ